MFWIVFLHDMKLNDFACAVMVTVTCFICRCKSKPSAPLYPLSVSRDNTHMRRIEAFKKKILDGLNYESVPNVSQFNETIAEKRKLIQMYRSYMEKKNGYQDVPEVTSEDRVHKYVLSKDMSTTVGKRTLRLKFKPEILHPDDHTKETFVVEAKLKLFKHTQRMKKSKNEYSIKILNVLLGNEIVTKSRTVDVSRDGWEIFDVSDILRQWIDGPTSNLSIGIYTDAPSASNMIFPSIEDFHINSSTNNSNAHPDGLTFPILELKTHERSILKRVKRQDSGRRDCVKGDGEERCCRFTTTISFSDIRWDDWIIAPASYEAHYCNGTCPDRFKMANTFAGIQARLHELYPSKFPKPCCVPSKLSPLTILHKDKDGRYKFTDYPDMVVEECKCA